MEIVKFLLEHVWIFSVCIFPLFAFIGWVFWGMMDNKQIAKKDAYNEALRKRGITAPATVVSARHTVSRSPFGRKEMRIDYEVDVQPAERTPFRQSFQHWTAQRNYATVAGQLVGEKGKKIWVTYDPNDPSQIIYEHDDSEHEKIIKQQELDKRRAEFNELALTYQEIKKNGEAAEAVIAQARDLELPYPLKNSRAMHLIFEVRTASGTVFKSETYALILEGSLEKFSAGKKIFI